MDIRQVVLGAVLLGLGIGVQLSGRVNRSLGDLITFASFIGLIWLAFTSNAVLAYLNSTGSGSLSIATQNPLVVSIIVGAVIAFAVIALGRALRRVEPFPKWAYAVATAGAVVSGTLGIFQGLPWMVTFLGGLVGFGLLLALTLWIQDLMQRRAATTQAAEPSTYHLRFASADHMRAAIAASVPGVRVALDLRTNAVIVYGTSTQHEQVKRILASLDVEPPATEDWSWLQAAAIGDEQSLGEHVMLVERSVDLSHVRDANPYVLFTFYFHNGSVFRISLANQVVGHVNVLGQHLKDVPELVEPSSPTWIPHGVNFRVVLQQWLLPEAATMIKQHASGSIIQFNFANMRIAIQYEPILKDGRSHSLRIGNVDGQMP